MSFFSFKSKSSLSFIFDIRDVSVTCAAVRFQKNQKPEMLVCRDFHIENSDTTDPEKHTAALLKTIDASIVGVTKALLAISHTEKVEKYLFFLGSPWSVSSVKIIHVVKDTPFLINDAFLQKIVTSEETALAKETQQKLSGKNWLVLEEKIIQAKLNGYAVEKIFERKANTLSVELFVSFVPVEIQEKLASFVDQKNGARSLRHANSSLLASYLFLKDAYPAGNFLYINIGELITDAYIVADGGISGIVSFPFGFKQMLAGALASSHLSEDVLVSQMTMKHSGHTDALSENNFQSLLKDGLSGWADACTNAVRQISSEINMPKTMLMYARDDRINFYIEEIAKQCANESLKICDTAMHVGKINESLANAEILNAKNFPAQISMKMAILFVQKIIH